MTGAGVAKCPKCRAELHGDVHVCPFCGSQQSKREKACPDCQEEYPLGSRFCPHCGAVVGGGAASVALVASDEPPVPPKGLTIEFPSAGSQVFDLALAEAMKHPSFAQLGNGKKSIYRVTFEHGSFRDALPLANVTKGWSRRVVYVDGEKLPWRAVFAFKDCFELREASHRPDLYCFGERGEWWRNIWGCHRTDLRWQNEQWFCYGRFVGNEGEWEFDKARIRYELQRDLFRVRYCPALDTGFVDSMLSIFPERVNPSRDRGWRYVRTWDETTENCLLVPGKNVWGEDQIVRMKGVAPKGFGAATKLAAKLEAAATQRIGSSPVGCRLILRLKD